MKKILASILSIVSVYSSHAQVTDTLGWSNFMAGTETLYESPNGGYAFGNNGYGDKAKAQTFSDSVSFVLKEVLLKFGAVEFNSGDSSSMILVNIYLNDGPGITLTSTSDSIAPDSIIATREVPVYDLLENDYVKVDFSTEPLVFAAFQKFSVGITLDSLAIGDTLGLVSTTEGDADLTQNAWELTSNDNWIVIAQPAYSWNLDVDLGIFAVIDRNDPAGIFESFYSHHHLSVYPNPTRGELSIDLESFDNSETTELLIVNQLGQAVWSNYSESQHELRLDLSELQSGVYTIRATSGSRVGVSKFIKR